MRKIHMIALCLLLSLHLTACNTREDLQQLSMIEVYAANGELVNVIEDADILSQFNDLDDTDLSTDADASQSELANATEDCSVLYTIISYKSSAALLKDESPEKLTKITVYENSDIIREQIDPDNVKGVSVPASDLTFYISISEEDKAFLLSLAEFREKTV